jgi:site-specific recombinase XerD
VTGFVGWLATRDEPGAALAGEAQRDWAARDYKRYLKTKRRLSPASVNLALAAIDSFYLSRGAGRPGVERERLAQAAPRASGEDERRRLLRAVERCPSARDRAIGLVLLYTGLRLSELANLEVDDVAVTVRKGLVTVRSGKGDQFRQVPLNSVCREAVTGWLAERAELVEAKSSATASLWVSRLGQSLSARAVGQVVEHLAAEAGLDGVSPHVLRHTFVTNLVRSGHDLVLMAELAGHRRLDTTRRYACHQKPTGPQQWNRC